MLADTKSFKSANIDTKTDILADNAADTDTETDKFLSLLTIELKQLLFGS
jgi:hypothetical protein